MKTKFLNTGKKLKPQFLKYLIVGSTAFVADFSVFYFLTEIIHLHYILSSFFSFIVGLMTNYTFATLWVFPSRKIEKRLHEFFLVSIISSGGMLLTLGILWTLTEQFHIYYLISKIITSILVLVYNFSLRKVFVYD